MDQFYAPLQTVGMIPYFRISHFPAYPQRFRLNAWHILAIYLFLFQSTTAMVGQPTIKISSPPETIALVSIQRTPELSSAPQRLGQFTVAVQNISGNPIAAIMIHVVITRFDNHIENRWILRHNFDNVNLMLPASAKYLVSAFGIPTDRISGKGLVGPSSENLLNELSAESASWREVSIGVDSVLQFSGQLVGPDEAGAFRMFSEWMQADRDISSMILQVRDGTTKNNLLQIFNSKKTDDSRQSFLTKDHFGERWVSQARWLEGRLHNFGEDELFRSAEAIAVAVQSRKLFRNDKK